MPFYGSPANHTLYLLSWKNWASSPTNQPPAQVAGLLAVLAQVMVSTCALRQGWLV
eukprot:c40105_g1_i1 orf=3-167(-)